MIGRSDEGAAVDAEGTGAAITPQKAQVLSFKVRGRPLTLRQLEAEFILMRSMLSKDPVPGDFHRVAMGSGSHLVKLTTPRADKDQCVLRVAPRDRNSLPVYAPSLNAPDIPLAKVVFRPLELIGHPPKSVVDHLREPDGQSTACLAAFAAVFGAECLEALRSAIAGPGQVISSLPEIGEFPIIFLPRPGGGDVQATPVSPVETFMGFKDMAGDWFRPQEKDAPPVPRGRWVRQAVSSKPQNISGAIGGARQRFLAEMPPVLRGYEAAVRRYALGGTFPAWRDDDVEPAVIAYHQLLAQDYSNRNMRLGLDRRADHLIEGALAFIREVERDARMLHDEHGIGTGRLPLPPLPSALILRRRWGRAQAEPVLIALTSEHFRDRERRALAGSEE
ncbi:hypothetical protein [Frigidibacter sp. MR17.24]|uniref:hypothetical protein n=1 Tax=Frigidibacter sp. MR17.24 TaxID=3127345 RepID=UPI0030131917